MKIVFIGAGTIFAYHSQRFCQASPKDSEFFVVEPDNENALLSKMTRISLEKAAIIADLAIVMTPSYIRWEVCEPFIKSGIPIVVEKPLTIHWDEITLFEAAAKNSFICPVVNIRMLKKIEEMKVAAINPTFIKSWKTRYRPGHYYDDWHGKFATDGGVLAQQGFHCLDLVCWIGGDIKEVSAIGINKKHDIEAEDTSAVSIAFSNGTYGRVDCTTAGNTTENDAGLEITTPTKVLITRGKMFAGGTSGHIILARQIFQALADKQGPPITVESAVLSLYALHACYSSMANDGAWTKIGVKSQLGR